MRYANAKLGTDERRRHSGIHVAINQHDVWPARKYNWLEAAHDGGRLVRMRSRAGVQAFVGAWNLQCLEEYFRHQCVIMLARVHQNLFLASFSQRDRKSTRLNSS